MVATQQMFDDGIERDGFRPGDVVLITGAGGGFGQAFAKRFARAGARLALWSFERSHGEEILAAVRALGAEAEFFQGDLADAHSITRNAQQTLDRFGTPYCIVNNASFFPRADVLNHSLEDWNNAFAVNVTAPFLIAKAFGQAMIAAGRGNVINVLSGRALQGAVNGGAYGATKAALMNFTKTLALEWARHGIRVNAIIPAQSLTAQPLAATPRDKLIEGAKTRVPLGRIGMPEDVTGIAMFLVSADGAYVTGQSMAVNGGVIMTP